MWCCIAKASTQQRNRNHPASIGAPNHKILPALHMCSQHHKHWSTPGIATKQHSKVKYSDQHNAVCAVLMIVVQGCPGRATAAAVSATVKHTSTQELHAVTNDKDSQALTTLYMCLMKHPNHPTDTQGVIHNKNLVTEPQPYTLHAMLCCCVG